MLAGSMPRYFNPAAVATSTGSISAAFDFINCAGRKTTNATAPGVTYVVSIMAPGAAAFGWLAGGLAPMVSASRFIEGELAINAARAKQIMRCAGPFFTEQSAMG